jgi:hypothetical protein
VNVIKQMSQEPFKSFQLPINATAGTSTLVSAVANTTIRVVAAFIVASGAATVNFQSHTTTTNKTGPVALAVNGGIVLPYNPDGWFAATLGEALDLVTTGAVAGSINYIQL